jgi:uncharacterized caspase-like protein
MRLDNRIPRLLGVFLVAMCLTMLAIAPLQSAWSDEGQQKFALLVGVSDYDPVCSYGDLKYSHKDALDMYNLLVIQYGWEPSNIVLLLNESATSANIMSGISWLKEECSNPHSTGFFFFSGHGSFFSDKSAIPDRDEPVDECIVPHDGDTQSVQQMIFDDTLKEQLDAFEPATIILMLDSCYSGGFIDDIESKGRLILTSCGEREMCWEGAETGKVQIENGVYTYCILEAFSGLGDLNGDGKVSMEEAGSYAMDRVREFTPDVQPEMSDGVDGDTYI